MEETDQLSLNKENISCGCCHENHSHSLKEERVVNCGCGCGHDHEHGSSSGYKAFIPPAISLILMVSGMIIDHLSNGFLNETPWANPLWYFISFIPVGFPVIKEAFEGILKGDYFNELTLMSIACVGAFLIGEYSEAVGVRLFYSIGETLQNRAVDKATKDISKLLDIRTEIAHVLKDGHFITVKPEEVNPGEIIEVRPGERVPLDGIVENEGGLFDTAALTGESVPRNLEKGQEVLAGMISSSSTVKIMVTKPYNDSAMARILELVKNAQNRKAKSEVFIRKFARIYTPLVTLCALLVVLIPALISFVHPEFDFVFKEWLYRALVFLVISCPCALVISVPLSYFAGIGAASKMGILFKGGNYLETITRVNTVAFDKTGTLTTGEFTVEKVESDKMDINTLLSFMAAGESESSHPLAKALISYVEKIGLNIPSVSQMTEIAGKGTIALINDQKVVTGNLKLLKDENISYPPALDKNTLTIVACAINGEFSGYVVMADTLKPDSEETVRSLKNIGVNRIVMLSGDRKEIVNRYAEKLNIKEAYGELLPQNKAEFVENTTTLPGSVVAFVGDGMNDAPVLSLSHVGIAMGGLGSDAAIESADVVIQTDRPLRVATAIKIGRYTHQIVYQNITGAIVIKIVVLGLGLTGIATLWAAVFADVGVTMLAVLNSMRIMWKKF